MKKGLIYGVVAWFLSLLIMPFIAPLIFHGGNMEALGSAWVPVSFFLIAVPAFITGYLKSSKVS